MKGGWPRGRGGGLGGGWSGPILWEEAAGTPRQGRDPLSVIPQAGVRTPSRAA